MEQTDRRTDQLRLVAALRWQGLITAANALCAHSDALEMLIDYSSPSCDAAIMLRANQFFTH